MENKIRKGDFMQVFCPALIGKVMALAEVKPHPPGMQYGEIHLDWGIYLDPSGQMDLTMYLHVECEEPDSTCVYQIWGIEHDWNCIVSMRQFFARHFPVLWLRDEWITFEKEITRLYRTFHESIRGRINLLQFPPVCHDYQFRGELPYQVQHLINSK